MCDQNDWIRSCWYQISCWLDWMINQTVLTILIILNMLSSCASSSWFWGLFCVLCILFLIFRLVLCFVHLSPDFPASFVFCLLCIYLLIFRLVLCWEETRDIDWADTAVSENTSFLIPPLTKTLRLSNFESKQRHAAASHIKTEDFSGLAHPDLLPKNTWNIFDFFISELASVLVSVSISKWMCTVAGWWDSFCLESWSTFWTAYFR